MAQSDWYLQLKLKARHLRLLVAIDDFGNLKQVAEMSHVTLPAVSKSLSELENGLGLRLFTRTAQGLRPTVYGECLIRHARAMQADIHKVRDELRALQAGSEGRIHVGVLPASASVLLPHALALLKAQAPGTSVLVTEGTTSTLLPELWRGKIDMVVGRLPTRSAVTGFEEIELLEEPVMLMTRPQHPLAQARKLKWSDLKPYPWVLPPTGSLLREPLEHVLERHKLALPNNVIETLSTHLARAYLNMTDAIAVMAGALATDPTQPLHVLPLALPNLMRPAGVLWNRNRALTPSAQQLLDCLREAAAKLGAPAQERPGP